MTMMSLCLSACSCLIFIFPMGRYVVRDRIFSLMGKNSGNPDLVCKKLNLGVFHANQISMCVDPHLN